MRLRTSTPVERGVRCINADGDARAAQTPARLITPPRTKRIGASTPVERGVRCTNADGEARAAQTPTRLTTPPRTMRFRPSTPMEIHEQSKLQAKKGPVCERGEKQTGQSGSLRGKTDGTMRTAALGRWGYQRHAYFEGGGGQKFQKLPKKFQKFLVAVSAPRPSSARGRPRPAGGRPVRPLTTCVRRGCRRPNPVGNQPLRAPVRRAPA